MKSSQEVLANRGYLKQGFEINYKNISDADKLQLLKSKVATERTLGARLLSKEQKLYAEELIRALKIENKLYPKIEICNALVSYSADSVKYLVAELGKIGTNQHRKIPDNEFCKDSYPLPRDIAGRILASIGKSAIPALLKVLDGNDEKQISEAIDAIGYICFYDCQIKIFKDLRRCYIKYFHNDLICWKLVRAMNAFPESVETLLEQQRICNNERIMTEINRSLRLIDKRKK